MLQIPALLDAKAIKAEVRLIKSRSQSHTFVLSDLEAPSEPAELLDEGPVVRQLLHWVSIVAGWYGYGISSFALAFADGSLLCRLVCCPFAQIAVFLMFAPCAAEPITVLSLNHSCACWDNIVQYPVPYFR